MKRKTSPPRPRGVPAAALAKPIFRQRRVKPLKGKASYKRRPKHPGGAFLSRALSV